VGLFSGITSFIKKKVIPRILPVATGFLTGGPIGAGAALVLPEFFDPTALIQSSPRAFNPIIPGTAAARAPGVATPGAPGFAGFLRRFLGSADIGTPGIAGPRITRGPQSIAQQQRQQLAFKPSFFAPRSPSVQPPTGRRLIRPIFRSFQPIFSPTGAVQNVSGGLIRFQQPAFSPLRGSFAGFGGIFSGRGFFRTGGTAPARAARPRGFGIFAGRGFTSRTPARGFSPVFARRALPARAAIATPQGAVRAQRAPTPSPRALGVQVQSQPQVITRGPVSVSRAQSAAAAIKVDDALIRSTGVLGATLQAGSFISRLLRRRRII